MTMNSKAIIRLTDVDHFFSHTVAARLACISVDFLNQCEQEGLFPYPFGIRHGFSAEEITRLSRIRRLNEDLGLDLSTIEIVLNMRQRILGLMTELEFMERQMAQREQALMSEIHRLQTLIADDLDFEDIQ
jgi:DNA-binding transcriptional MerR regulator